MISKEVLQYREMIIQNTSDLIKIPSVEGDPVPQGPFGEEVKKSLQYALRLAADLGFDSVDLDGYAGYAEFGQGEEMIGILVHLDVVPAGSDWSVDPFGGHVAQGKIYGRGAIDDKGPAIAALYAMKVLKDREPNISKKVRMIFGTNEETNWGGIKYYLNKEQVPNVSLVPDADFPVIQGEKGILVFEIEKSWSSLTGKIKAIDAEIELVSIKGGERANMVPDRCCAWLRCSSQTDFLTVYTHIKGKNIFNKVEKVSNQAGEKLIKLEMKGISAHGSLPQTGKNAIDSMFAGLSQITKTGPIESFLEFYQKYFYKNFNGDKTGCALQDKSGELIYNVGMITCRDNKISITSNIRYPVTYNEQDIYQLLENKMEKEDIFLKRGQAVRPIFFDEESKLLSSLLDVYRSVTGHLDAQPKVIGGGTYARSMENAIAFGPLLPGKKELAHQKDEYIDIDDLLLLTEIYIQALQKLL